MKKLVLTLLIMLAVAAPASALIHDNDLMYAWGDPYGDPYDNYAVVSPGETIRVSVFVNDLNGLSWANAADGGYTGIWWDQAVVDYTTVAWDADPALGADNYYKAYYGFMHPGSNGAHYYNVKYDGSGTYRWVAENRLIISWSMTIREDAPFGETTIGLQQAFYWGLPYNPWVDPFFSDRIESNDPYAMTLLVVPDTRTGDFDGDGDIDADDIDALGAAITAGSTDLVFDMDGNGLVELADFDLHVTTLVDTLIGEGSGTMFGDFNLDGLVDLIDLAVIGEQYGVGTGWATGDSNGDALVDLIDLAAIGENYGFAATAPIPEPATMTLLGLGAVALIRRRK